jgi:DNA-binding NarL/FixJ family response regulator
VKNPILILDTCSVENWSDCLHKWNLEGGAVITLLSPEICRPELELQMLRLGVAGILSFVDLQAHLANVVYAVAAGRLWFRRDVLDAYVKQTRSDLRHSLSPIVTTREKQILDLLHQDLPNRLIAQRLTISERTIKFHISNILRKLNVASRKELRGLYSTSTTLSCCETLTFERKRPGSVLI